LSFCTYMLNNCSLGSKIGRVPWVSKVVSQLSYRTGTGTVVFYTK
jgi:hypothetical protein